MLTGVLDNANKARDFLKENPKEGSELLVNTIKEADFLAPSDQDKIKIVVHAAIHNLKYPDPDYALVIKLISGIKAQLADLPEDALLKKFPELKNDDGKIQSQNILTKKNEIIKSILSDYTPEKDVSPLALALIQDDFDLFKFLSAQGADITYMQKDKPNLLHFASYVLPKHPKTDWVATLLKTRLNTPTALNWPWNPGDSSEPPLTPLSIAIEHHDINAITMLSENGAKADETTLSIHLIEAVASDNKKLTELLIKIGAKIDQEKLSARLAEAVNSNNHNQAVNLIKNGADPNAKTSAGIAIFQIAIDDNNLPLAKMLLQHGADPFTELNSNKNAIHQCSEKIAKLMLEDAKQETIEEWSSFQQKLEENYIERYGHPCPPNLSQSNLILRIKLYVKEHNKRVTDENQKIHLPVSSDDGWCAGLSSVYGYLKTLGDPKFNEEWFFKNLHAIATAGLNELTTEEQFPIEKIIGYVNLLQGEGKEREEYGFDSLQGDLNQSLGLTITDAVPMVFQGRDEIKMLLEDYVMTHPNQFMRLSGFAHSTTLVYDDKKQKFIYYDPNQTVGNIPMTLASFKEGQATVFDTQTPQLELTMDELLDKIPEVFSEDVTRIPLILQLYQPSGSDDLDKKKEGENKKQQFYQKIFSQRTTPNHINLTSKSDVSSLRVALQRGDLKACSYFIEQGADLLSDYGALTSAILSSNTEIQDFYMKALSNQILAKVKEMHPNASENEIKAQAAKMLTEKLNQPLADKISPIQLMISKNKKELIRTAVENGFDINGLNALNISPLGFLLAADKNKYSDDMMEFLIQQGADVNNVNGIAPIMMAIRIENLAGIKRLLAYGVEVPPNMLNSMILNGIKNKELFSLLCQHSDLRSDNKFLNFAVDNANIPAIEILLDQDTLVSAEKGKAPPLLIAIFKKLPPEIIRKLIEKGADVNQVYQGLSALTLAVEQENVPLFKKLVEQGADINNPNLTPPLIYQLILKRLEEGDKPNEKTEQLILYLFEQGVTYDENFMLPEHGSLKNLLSRHDQDGAIRKLIAKGLTPNKENRPPPIMINIHEPFAEMRPVTVQQILSDSFEHYKQKSVTFEQAGKNANSQKMRENMEKVNALNFILDPLNVDMLSYVRQTKSKEQLQGFSRLAQKTSNYFQSGDTKVKSDLDSLQQFWSSRMTAEPTVETYELLLGKLQLLKEEYGEHTKVGSLMVTMQEELNQALTATTGLTTNLSDCKEAYVQFTTTEQTKHSPLQEKKK